MDRKLKKTVQAKIGRSMADFRLGIVRGMREYYGNSKHHPLGDIPEKVRSFREDEKIFYTAVLEYLMAEEAKETIPVSAAKQAAGNSRPCCFHYRRCKCCNEKDQRLADPFSLSFI